MARKRRACSSSPRRTSDPSCASRPMLRSRPSRAASGSSMPSTSIPDSLIQHTEKPRSNCFGAFLQTELMESVIYSTFFWWGRQRNSADTLKWNLCKCIADIQISIGTCECNFLQCEFRGSFDTFDIILRVFRGEGTLFDDNADIVDHHGKHLQHNRRHGSRGADGPAHPAMHRKLADCCKR